MNERLRGTTKLNLLLPVYGAIVIAGKLTAVPPSIAERPPIADAAVASLSCGVARQAASCKPAPIAAPLANCGQELWRNAPIKRTRRTGTSSSS
jgi:hypothetical protein